MSSLIARLAVPLALLIADSGHQSPAHAGPDRYKVGAYVTAIHDLNVAAGTFGADLWIWTVGHLASAGSPADYGVRQRGPGSQAAGESDGA
jgi:hypothetical protein